MQEPTLERALQAIERDADVAVRSLAAALKEARRAKAAAATGQLRDLRQSLDATAQLADEARVVARDVRAGWGFDEQAYFASGAYAEEILALAAEDGVQVFESDERILCYPAIIELSPADATVVVDKKKDRKVRPSVLVRRLKALQSRPATFKAQAFLESLAVAYDLVVARKGGRPGAPQKLVDLYAVFTVLPGSSREYTRQEFARDLYLLDQSGETVTKSGRNLHLPASALTRGTGVLTTVTRNGQAKVYAGISFEGGGR